MSQVLKSRTLPFLPFLLMLGLSACPGENACDTAGYPLPEIELLVPDNPQFEVHPDTMFTLVFSLKAEAGLNTISMNGEPLQAFTRGEKEEILEISRYFWEGGELLFILHDLCDRSAEISLNMTVVYPM